jgi:hypothetical protein
LDQGHGVRNNGIRVKFGSHTTGPVLLEGNKGLVVKTKPEIEGGFLGQEHRGLHWKNNVI